MQVTLAYLKRTTWFSSILSPRQPLSPKTHAPATMCLGCAAARSFPFRSEERDLFRRQPFRRIDTRRGGFAVDRFAGGGFLLNDRSTKTKNIMRPIAGDPGLSRRWHLNYRDQGRAKVTLRVEVLCRKGTHDSTMWVNAQSPGGELDDILAIMETVWQRVTSISEIVYTDRVSVFNRRKLVQ